MPDNPGRKLVHGECVPARVSVVIPAYNAARTLGATLESVRTQTMADFEVLVVDDGSSDETFEIAAEYSLHDMRFGVLRQVNTGVADARNAGIRHTQAPLIATLDADDVWHPTFLAKLCQAMEEGGSDTVLAYTNTRIIDLSGHVLWSAPFSQHSGRVFSLLLLRNFIGNGSAMMFRREVALQVGTYDRRLQHQFAAQGAEDWLLAMKLAACGNVAVVREYLVGYRSVPGAMSENALRMRRSRLYALVLLLSDGNDGGDKTARRALGTAHAKCFLREVLDGRFADAGRNLVAALHLDFVGTCYLLFGRQRWHWLAEKIFPRPPPSPGRPFLDIDTREGQAPTIEERIEATPQWDMDGTASQTDGSAGPEAIVR